MLKAKYSVMLLAGTLAVFANAEAAQSAKPVARVPMVQDWSTDRVFFGKPDTPEEARAHGHYERWQQLASDPRFMLSLINRLKADSESPARTRGKNPPPPPPPPPPVGSIESMHRDWSNVLGGSDNGTGGSGVVDVFPAKYSFDTSVAPNCANDFVVYGTNAAGAASSGTQAKWDITFAAATSTGAVTIGTAPRNITITAGLAPGSGAQYQTSATANTSRDNFIAAVNLWTGRTGFSAAANGAGVARITKVSTGVGAAGEVTETLTNGSVAFVAGAAGTGQANIVAFNQLYNTTCPAGAAGRANANAPNVYWAYNTGGTVKTSPLLSYFDNAIQVAFIQTVAGDAQLVLLKWKAGTNAAPQGTLQVPLAPTLETAANYRAGTGACATGACMFIVNFSGVADDTTSSPFIDYFGDALYVGLDDGTLRKVSGIFSGTPTEVGAPFSTVSAGNKMSSPVYDFNGSVFIGSASAVGSGGRIHKIDAVAGGIPLADSTKLTLDTVNSGVRASPMIDVVNHRVYAFVLFGTTAAAPATNCTVGPCREMIEFGGAFPPTGPGNRVLLGSSVGYAATQAQPYGTFSTAWRNSGTGTGPMYVCGGDPTTGFATLWKIPISAGQIGAATRGAPVANAAGVGCSPMTRVKNGTEDYLYLSVVSNGVAGSAQLPCTGSCMYLYNTADLNGNSNDTPEVWTMQLDNKNGANVSTGTVVLQPGNVTISCLGTVSMTSADCTFNNDGVARAASFATAVNNWTSTTGITASNGGTDTVTFTQLGNVADTNVTIAVTHLLGTSHTDGTSPAPATAWGPTNSPTAGLTTPNGAGGLIIDNVSVSPLTGAAQVYFGQLSATGNAIQASQSGLQ